MRIVGSFGRFQGRHFDHGWGWGDDGGDWGWGGDWGGDWGWGGGCW